ncbi:MAG: hypothetical protein ACE5DX_05720 [Candidatus Dojkabacteria bacterium]
MAGSAAAGDGWLITGELKQLRTSAAIVLRDAGWSKDDIYEVLTAADTENLRIVETMKNEVTTSLRMMVQGQAVGDAIQITSKEVMEAIRLVMDRLDPITQKMQIDSRSSLMILSDKEEIELNRKIGIRDGLPISSEVVEELIE